MTAPWRRLKVRKIWLVTILLVLGGVIGLSLVQQANNNRSKVTLPSVDIATSQQPIDIQPNPTPSTPTPPTPAPATPKPATFDKTKYSIDQPGSIWIVVNKKRPLPSTYAPGGLTSATKTNLDSLMAASRAARYPFKVISGYRSYNRQSSLYNSYVQQDGQAAADTYSARPGHSEHQTGLAVDLGNSNGSCDLEGCFGDTGGGKWLTAHAHEHGFIIRYRENKQAITGYKYEPWHIRYVGKNLATEIHKQNTTLEEFFNLPAAPNY